MELPIHIIAVGGLVINSQNNVLLVKHVRRGWEIPGGQVEQGEDLIKGIEREILEETNLICRASKIVALYSNLKHGYSEIYKNYIPSKLIIDFSCDYKSGSIHKSPEHIEIEWINKDKVLEVVSSEIMKRRITNLLNNNEGIVYMSFETEPYKQFLEQKM